MNDTVTEDLGGCFRKKAEGKKKKKKKMSFCGNKKSTQDFPQCIIKGVGHQWRQD